MLKVGLTGGIGSGKSTVAHLFAKLGVPIIDADIIAREVLTTHAELLPKIYAHFGPAAQDEHGQLNRAFLRSVIFAQPEQRQWLEALLHPYILNSMAAQVQSLDTAYCLLVIPLLTEVSQSLALVDRILVVDVSESTQRRRVQERDQLKPSAVDQILHSQASRQKRLTIADDIIDNNTDLDTLSQRVQALHEFYLSLAKPS